jgi:hypothetical protein
MKFYYKYYHNQFPASLQNFSFKTRSEVHDYNTRNKHILCTNKVNTKTAEQTLRNVTLVFVNSLPDCVKDTHSLPGLTFYYKYY